MAGFGETLQQARAHKGVTLKEVEQFTRISRKYLTALEEENFEALPPPIYQRGIVRNYAVYLELDPARVLTLFEEAHGQTSPTRAAQAGVTPMPPVDMPKHWSPNFAIIAFAVVLAGIVSAWFYSAYVAESDNQTTATIVVPTMTPYQNDLAIATDPPLTPTTQPTVKPTDAPTPTAEVQPTEVPVEDAPTDGGDNQRAQQAAAETEAAAAPTEEPVVEEPTEVPVEETEVPEDTSGDLASSNQARYDNAMANGSSVAGITITAEQGIQLTVVVDGDVVFDQWLDAGQSTGEIVGSSYEVTTSIGGATLFTDACGNAFYMGYEAGEASYPLTASSGSCAPSL